MLFESFILNVTLLCFDVTYCRGRDGVDCNVDAEVEDDDIGIISRPDKFVSSIETFFTPLDDNEGTAILIIS